MFARIFISVLTMLTFLAMLGFTVLGFVKGIPILAVSCGFLVVMLGFFSYADIRYWINVRKAATIVVPTTKV